MTSTRLAAYIGGASLLLAWLASASGVTRQPQRSRVPSRPEDAAVLQSVASDVQSQAERLRKRLAAAPAPAGRSRNPFAFRTREVRRADPAIAPLAVETETESAPAPPVEPTLSLAGVAEQNTAKGTVRTAMITLSGDELFLLKEGETFLGRYEVVAIGADAVELKDAVTGATRRLALQQ